MSIKHRLIVMNFLEFFIWGSWLISLGGYMIVNLKFTGGRWAASAPRWALPAVHACRAGIVPTAANAERVLGACHILARCCCSSHRR
jgi:NHS family xanthosine MFS transporter